MTEGEPLPPPALPSCALLMVLLLPPPPLLAVPLTSCPEVGVLLFVPVPAAEMVVAVAFVELLTARSLPYVFQ